MNKYISVIQYCDRLTKQPKTAFMKNLYANECSARLRTQAASGIARRAALAALAAALLPALPATAGEGGATPPRGTEATAQAAPARRVTCRVLDDKGNPVVGEIGRAHV